MVSRSNYMEYIDLLAHFKLNVQLLRQYQMFREGLEQVIPAQWLRLFSQRELQVLISGAQVPIDVTDLRSYTTYKGRGDPTPPIKVGVIPHHYKGRGSQTPIKVGVIPCHL